MYEISLNEDNKLLEIKGNKKVFPKSIAYIEGKVEKNKGDYLELSNIKFGIIVDKKTGKIQKALSNLDKIKINLNYNNKFIVEKNEYIKLGISRVKNIQNPDSNYQLIKKKYYFKILKG